MPPVQPRFVENETFAEFMCAILNAILAPNPFLTGLILLLSVLHDTSHSISLGKILEPGKYCGSIGPVNPTDSGNSSIAVCRDWPKPGFNLASSSMNTSQSVLHFSIARFLAC